jgi:signal peptidase I
MVKNLYAGIIAQGIEERGAVRTVFTGRSMEPTLLDGMMLAVEKSDPHKIRIADIILYKKSAQMVVHRVIGILRKDINSIFITKGDNQIYSDCDHVPEEDLLGVVSGAFFENEPQVNALVGNRFIGLAYSLMGSSVLFATNIKRYIPRSIRFVLKYPAGGFFFLFNKSIHSLYIGMRYGQLFIRRRCVRPVSV